MAGPDAHVYIKIYIYVCMYCKYHDGRPSVLHSPMHMPGRSGDTLSISPGEDFAALF